MKRCRTFVGDDLWLLPVSIIRHRAVTCHLRFSVMPVDSLGSSISMGKVFSPIILALKSYNTFSLAKKSTFVAYVLDISQLVYLLLQLTILAKALFMTLFLFRTHWEIYDIPEYRSTSRAITLKLPRRERPLFGISQNGTSIDSLALPQGLRPEILPRK